ncbi:MAG: twin-arginine translocase subunit TatC, partial [Candidatus Omnitrophica bacterium]|nr:twin-arginine translocase subunit TatC [Candidatus Omnitrophota bacterium]
MIMYEKSLPLIVHLAELRKRIIIACISVVIASFLAMPFSSALLGVLTAPAQSLLGKLAVFSPQEALAVYVRIGIVSGIVASVPVILYQAWLFIVPALGLRTRRYAFWFIATAALAFFAGCMFAYFILIPPALRFLLSIGTNDFMPLISASKYISFITTL